MAKKTWVKLKRGLLTDPKHRMALGNRIWLYLYMLDVTDWSTGKILEWRDKDAADELQMPLTTIRNQRREIENEGYISCRQYHNRQTITIKRWVNPREYSGKIYNTDDFDDEGDQLYEPDNLDENTEGDQEGVNEGDQGGIQNLTPLHINHISHITESLNNGEIDLFDACARVYEKLHGRPVTDAAAFTNMIKEFIKEGVTIKDYSNAIIAMKNHPKYKRATNPTSPKKWAIGYAYERNNPSKPNNGKPVRTVKKIGPDGKVIMEVPA